MKNFLLKVINKLLRSSLPPARYAVKLKRKYRLKLFKQSDKKVLEICGGIMPVSPENINVDIMDDPKVDIIADLHNQLPFEDNSIDKIISIATLMHLGLPDMRKALVEFCRILKAGGTLEIGIPSLEKIFDYYKKNGLDDTCVRHLHGAQKSEFDIHLCVMDFKRIKQELAGLGFGEAEEATYDFPTQDGRFYMKINAKKI
ncbi:MAG: Tetratricopeptide repeat domain with UbiE methylase [Parcubacteria group bacterium GW2011_GWC2_42_12]|uniref:Methyltransferase type 11 domain-containing protein n=1 Tax=Candidatus Falkowbacteria bacterium RIFCSPHIGHO2_02_FULL_42_9 TaxID=1797986 RepID=A0A1F5S9T6_9BACT|nr:MAG: Tetratricopeptide repeat domain with UbiE methylase [Parcubacteria group bacterium GW2011_GWC2_42_12]OGF23480.1 MAG: hypothetical protein A3D45_01155 [Candidatus Falkowbacteria bacterium RIFCSPHIGHO2_02_FULL_42_9]